MTVHFISDLHLTDEHPHLLALFDHYLTSKTQRISALYILGDLFEVWIGDDYKSAWIDTIIERFQSLHQIGIKLYFCHGNRDFLVGNEFANAAGVELLPEYSLKTINRQKLLLCHGDSLCIDDLAYQEFRSKVRTAEWQTQFLSMSIEQRLSIVSGYRTQSKQATAEKTNEILDVNQVEVSRVFSRFNTPIMIHGHTHRPALHKENGLCRIVLSDWGKKGHYLSFDGLQFNEHYFDLHSDQKRLLNH